jgi:phospholipid transport system substrate-binding protein
MALRVPGLRQLVSSGFVAALLLAEGAGAEPPRSAGSATDELRRHLDQVMATVQTPSFRELDPVRRREEIRRISAGLFNWPEMSRRALGSEWRGRSVAERRGFATSFGALAEAAYVGQIEQLSARGVPRDSVRLLGETTSGAETTVRTALMYPHERPIDFVMSRRGARWQVHDVVIDGVSVAENYGAQFRRVMARDSFSGLVGRMTTRTTDAPADTVGATPR